MSKNKKKKALIVGNLAKDIILKEEKYGGSATIIAISLFRLGISVDILSVVGKDHFSNNYINYLKKIGIGTEYIYQKTKKLPICITQSNINSLSRNRWIDNGCHEAMDKLKKDEIPSGDYDIVHLVSSPPRLSLNVSKKLNNISYHPGPLLLTRKEYFNEDVAIKSKFLFLNEEEYLSLLKYKIKLDCKKYNLLAAVITLGKKGSIVFDENNNRKKIPSVMLNSLYVDPGGAGDNYIAGFLMGYLMGKSINECAKIGSFLGARTVELVGGILPLKILKEINNIIT